MTSISKVCLSFFFFIIPEMINTNYFVTVFLGKTKKKDNNRKKENER